MADIFISYAREDRRWATNLARAIKSYGWSTWWDSDVPPGVEYDQLIEDEIREAKCVIVGWSQTSIQSLWVKDEAQEALDLRKLFPVLIDAVKPPMGFRRIHNVDLADWDGTINAPQLKKLVKNIEKKLGPAPNQDVQQEEYKRTLDFFNRLVNYDTGHITFIYRIARSKDGEVIESHLVRANSHAYRFYNLAPGSIEIPVNELIKIVEQYVDSKDMAALLEDQERIAEDLDHGRVCEAKVPIRVNSKHPRDEFRDQCFMPLIAAFSGKFSVAGHIEELLAVTYINLSNLCQKI